MSRAPRTRCDSCGKGIPKAVRVEDGFAYCRKCYQVTFESTQCGRCGSGMRAHYNDPSPVCRDCERAERACLRCGRAFKKAGRLVKGGALCASCAPHFRPQEACSACGQVSKRLSRVSCQDGPVCDSCRKPNYVTCAVCRRHRPHAGESPEGKPLCGECLPGREVTHECPDCGEAAPGRGRAPCHACSLRRRAWRRAHLDAELLDRDWCRDLFHAFCAWLIERCQAGNLTRRIDNYARFFEVLDKQVDRPDQISQSGLARLFTPEELRRHYVVVRFFIERRGLQWRKSKGREIAQARKIDEQLASCRDEPWSALINDYYHYLRARPTQLGAPLNEGTIKAYLDAAIALLIWEDSSGTVELDSEAPRRFVRRRPGYSASLTPFTTFLSVIKGLDVKPPPKRPARRREFERRLIREVRTLLTRLEVTTDFREARALIARLIARVYQVPLVDVLALRWAQVSICGNRICLLFESGSIELAAELSEPALRWLNPGGAGSRVFPGRIPALPMSSSNVRYYLDPLTLDRSESVL